MNSVEACQVIKEIQRLYYLHDDDILYRTNNPTSPETNRQIQGINRLERTLDLYGVSKIERLSRISKQLYTDITHFILELIQNADDNSYNANVEATLSLQLSRNRLIVKCNEVGFTEQNMRALCDINASTKRERKQSDDGCIGEKGIGT
jgi:hypothetical protein